MVFKQEFDDVAADSAAPIRYRTRPGVDFTTAVDPKTGAHQFFAKDRASGDTYHLGEEELFICQLLDGVRSLDEIQSTFKGRFGLKLTHKQLSDFLRELHAAGFLAAAEAVGPAVRPVSDARPAERAEVAEQPTPFHFRLFNPARLFGAFAWLFHPFRFFIWLLPPATLLAGLVLFHRRVDIFLDHDIVAFSTTALLAAGLATLMATNLLSRIVQGSVVHAFGATVRDFGITFSFGIIPGFYIDRRPINLLTHRERVWCHAAPLLARLAFFVIGTFLWISLRPTASGVSEIAFFVGQVGFWSLLFSAIPFLPTDGYLLVASIFGRADYMDRAIRVLGMRVAGQPLPQALRTRDKWLLLLFAGALMLCIAAVVAAGILFFGVPLEDRYRGAGAAMIVAACGLASLWLFFTWRSIERLRAEAKAGVAPHPNVVSLTTGGQATIRPAAAPYAPAAPSPTIQKPRRSLVPYLIWGAAIVGLAIVAFLPYPYEAGGDFLVLPSTRVEVHARVDGEVLDLFIKEGDWVEEGQPLARLSNWDETRDLAVAKASLEKARAELQVLEDGPKPEDIKFAESQVAAANARISFSRAEADRQSQLMKAGTSSKRDAEHAFSEYNKDLADLAVAQANLNVAKSGPTESMIEVSKADVSKYQEQVAYLESQLERTEVRAPIAGHIVTSNIELQRGMYLTVGTLFAVIERNQVAQAEILVPETDIGEVKAGASVRLRPWGDSDREIVGHVVSISPAAEKTPYGPVVHVKTEVDNADGFLRADMTGYAKIAGSEMPVWEAYTRLFVRFFNIEVWSWIP